MLIRWYGQSAFLLTADRRVLIDPFADIGESMGSRGRLWKYTPIEPVEPDLLLITHEHFDHNAGELAGAAPAIRATAGKLDSPIGEVTAIASEHDEMAGTLRGPNSIFCFELDGLRICHFGDFGQTSLRPEQREAIGETDVLFLPVGGGPTVGGQVAVDIVRALAPRVLVPMHYRTDAIDFLDPPDAFFDALGAEVVSLPESEFELAGVLGTREAPKVAVPAVPMAG